ncbi:MAG: hypothetical protein U9Q30_01865 [Campylobacterota bacterium]|nr:hypothetical protein [Campylobacterota bacterium]
MLKFLDGLVLFKEIYEIVESSRFHSVREFREKYKKDTIVINRISYIKKDILPDDLKDKVTELTEYISLTYSP